MILEALAYLAIPCASHLRRMGYPGELVAIAARYRRRRRDWADHLANSRCVVEDAIARTRGRSRAVVLGAGLLHDVPLAALAAAFAEVELVDLVHTPWTRWQAKRLGNVRLVAADVTGTLASLADFGGPDLPVPEPSLGTAPADLVVSANLLSQLPILPIAWLDRRRCEGLALSADAIVEFGRSLISSHLDLLARQAGTVALITDVERMTFDARRHDRQRRSFTLTRTAAIAWWAYQISVSPRRLDRRTAGWDGIGQCARR